MALHINAHGEHPIFFYGQAYMGSLEAYLAAPVFRLLGASDFTLRLGLVFLAAIFFILMYALTTLLYDQRVALWTLLFLSLGSSELLARQVEADGGYPELLVFGATAIVLASYLSMTSLAAGKRATFRRRVTYGLWGLTVGLGIWSAPLMLPFAAMSGLLLICACRPEFRGSTVAALALGLSLGLAPIITYNFSTTPGRGTVGTVLSIMHAGGSGHTSDGPSPISQRLAGLVAVSIPVITGGSGLCSLPVQDAWPLSSHSSRHIVTCTAIHTGWGIGWLICWLLAVLGGLFSVVWIRRRNRTKLRETQWEQYESARYLARLVLLGAAGLTVALFMLTPAPAHAPWFNVRYLTGLWIAFPAILAPVIRAGAWIRTWQVTVSRALRYSILLLLGVALVSNVIGTYGDASYANWLHGQLEAAARTLVDHHVKHVYADYWTCDWLAIETHESVTCAVIDARLAPGLDRYPPYRSAVVHDRGAWYLFRSDGPEAASFARMVTRVPGRYRRTTLPAFTIYQPLDSERP